jgi:hypothetical protein
MCTVPIWRQRFTSYEVGLSHDGSLKARLTAVNFGQMATPARKAAAYSMVEPEGLVLTSSYHLMPSKAATNAVIWTTDATGPILAKFWTLYPVSFLLLPNATTKTKATDQSSYCKRAAIPS